ncbi:hypothetical protein PSTG_04911 [Puccinia striiformis f. sp. tritici PST-78]|uniref:CID domain-containing protein n=1 Tax=Puccinia striiformis f. sp. tritici PST-78 TaxID=1165861 RepID=A0A0L0VR88_9BASI|nr:hypothetical protein PSTG_04911 [Puccinia striiformis f. sp. tritici PST-78]
MDGFEVRLQLVSILKKLSSSQNSIQSTIRFLLKHKDKYGEDLWDCLVEEAEKVNLNARINILYLIDGLLFTSSTALLTSHQEYQHSRRTNLPSSSTIISTSFNYGDLIKKDIIKLIEIVVPTSFNKKGLLNLMSTVQVIKNWKSQISIIDHFLTLDLLEQIDQILNHRKQILGKMEVNDTQVGIEDNELLDFTKKEILDRIDDDRERHKRLRERIWVLPIPSMSSLSPKLTNIQHPSTTYTYHRSATLLHTSLQSVTNSERPSSSISSGGPTGGGPHIELDLTISLECDQLINANLEDTGSAGLEDHDWNAIHFDNHRCFGLASNHHRLLDQFVDF